MHAKNKSTGRLFHVRLTTAIKHGVQCPTARPITSMLKRALSALQTFGHCPAFVTTLDGVCHK